ncbi:Rrf2 family transcriptional regulator [Acidisoma cellulosilytica]|uniref:Rrf2 family transcriptional regulator n=1 Tax=Acidisoma cellulosilyticum TaxID=2802395 RepID=A0A963Z2W2_9PROT|nr:Rrf2 family transcriptional regulator [Acidisoma cellulosilyticum]MCB8880962.1 Rrf2 family transcriptional regulator [Acidisoma cellulosilyticum]
MLSSRAKYALRAILILVEEAEADRWTSAQTIAERSNTPRKFLEAILVQLRDQGFIQSRRGPVGGHKLLLPPEQISVADVMRIIDGPIALTPCASRTRFAVCKDCKDIETCQLTDLMRRVRDAAAAVLEGCTLADLARMPEAGAVFSL